MESFETYAIFTYFYQENLCSNTSIRPLEHYHEIPVQTFLENAFEHLKQLSNSNDLKEAFWKISRNQISKHFRGAFCFSKQRTIWREDSYIFPEREYKIVQDL